MGYANPSLPRNAPYDHDHSPRYATAPAKAKKLALPKILQDAFDTLENWPNCKCKLSLMSICLIGKEQGCWHRRQHKRCDCKLRWLPSCLETSASGCNRRRLSQHSRGEIPECLLEHPEGCEQRQRSGNCSCDLVPKPACACPLVQMPCCMASGCPDRQLGHLCDCPRGSATVCEHMLNEEDKKHVERSYRILAKYAKDAGRDPYDFWAMLQRRVKPKEHFSRLPPGKAKDMTDRGEAVRVLEMRAECHVGLFHPGDLRAPLGEAERQRQVGYLQNVAAFFKQISKVA